MGKNKKYLGYEKDEILEIFRTSEDQVDTNRKIGQESTLSQLSEASGKMLKENKEFLYMVYNELDK